jgi:EAL domain-containing protein (putative c-di-GMP-specific phosphodiesterase class I)
MAITAEGIETAEQLDAVRGAGLAEVQGYFFSRPRPAAEIASLIRDRMESPAPTALPPDTTDLPPCS